MEEDTFIKSDVPEFVAANLVNSGGRNGVDARGLPILAEWQGHTAGHCSPHTDVLLLLLVVVVVVLLVVVLLSLLLLL